MRYIFNKNPFYLESSEPFTRFPPIFKGFVMVNVRNELGNPQELVAVNYTAKITLKGLSMKKT